MRRELSMLAALAAALAVIWASNGSFIHEDNLDNLACEFSRLGLLAIGGGIVIIAGGIDLSVGSIVGLTGVLIAKISSHAENCLGRPIALGIAVALGVALLVGLLQGLLISRCNLQPFIVTLGTMLLLRGVSQVIVEGGSLSFGTSPFRLWFDQQWLHVPYLVFILVAAAGAAGLVLHGTVLGRYFYAVGGNREAAQYSGVPVPGVLTTAYVISALLAGVSGVCYAAYVGQMNQDVGMTYELKAIAAAVLGGCSLSGGEGSIAAVLIGSAFLCVIETGINFFTLLTHDAAGNPRQWRIGPNWVNLIIGSVILGAALLDQVAHVWQKRRRTRKAGTP